MPLTGKIALITGVSGGVGSAVARWLADQGMTVIGTYNGTVPAVDESRKSGGQIHFVQLDQRSPASIEALAEVVSQRHECLDLLVNNAAWNVGIPFNDLDGLTPELWDKVLETNLRGPFLMARALAPLLKAHGRGRIVNISSVAGVAPMGSSIAYASGKAGLNHLTRCLAVAMAPDVAVNCIALGLVENTRMSNRSLDQDGQKALRKNVLLGRNVQLDDVCSQILTFLNSTSITGQTVVIDGGIVAALH